MGLAKRLGFDAARFVKGFRGFAGLRTSRSKTRSSRSTALEWHEKGMDFADAMHLGRAEGCEAFLSFDKRLAKAAAKVGAMEVREP